MASSNHSVYRFLVLGLIATTMGFILFKTTLTFGFFLTPIKGTINNADTYVSIVTVKGNTSQKCDLVFHLRGHNQQFEISKNIGNLYSDVEYDRWAEFLKKSDSVKVWVRKTEVEAYMPKIFQIEVDHKLLLPEDSVRSESALPALLLTVLGLGSLVGFAFLKCPDRMRRIFNIKVKDSDKNSQMSDY
jgi:hypothetical protein